MGRTTTATIRVATHRGLEPDKQDFFFESSIEAFADHVQRGYSLEFDPAFTSDGIVVWHDYTMQRLTGGRDARPLSEVTSADVLVTPLTRGRLGTLEELLQVLDSGADLPHFLHLKGAYQTKECIERLADVLAPFTDLTSRLVIIDVKPRAARRLLELLPSIQLAASVAHPYDIMRYGKSVHGTLLAVRDAFQQRDLYQWVWLDEWDRTDVHGGTKKLYCPSVFDTFRNAGFKVGVASPELHGSSPGLLGGETHPDAKDANSLWARLDEIIALHPDVICTDHPQQLRSKLL